MEVIVRGAARGKKGWDYQRNGNHDANHGHNQRSHTHRAHQEANVNGDPDLWTNQGGDGANIQYSNGEYEVFWEWKFIKMHIGAVLI